MSTNQHTSDALARLRHVFHTAATELTDTDAAELARLDEEECRVLLRILLQTGLIEQRRARVFVGRIAVATAG